MPPALIDLPINPIIDSNVLFDFLLWRYCVGTGIEFPGCLSGTSAEKYTMQALQWFFDEAKPIHTSPHVIAEINGLLQARADWHH